MVSSHPFMLLVLTKNKTTPEKLDFSLGGVARKSHSEANLKKDSKQLCWTLKPPHQNIT